MKETGGVMQTKQQKGNVIDVTAGLLEKIRTTFCRVGDETSSSCTNPHDGGGSFERRKDGLGSLKQSLMLCMEEVEGQGFERGDVEDSMRYVVGMMGKDVKMWEYVMYDCGVKRGVVNVGQMIGMVVMNDLLSRLCREDLPLYYNTMSKSVDQARVVGSLPLLPQEKKEATEQLQVQKQQQREEEAKRKKQQEEEKEEREEEEKARRNAWILQNMAYSSEDSYSNDDSASSDDEGSIEDWEIWGSPGEIERKKAEKARKTLSREDTIAIIAHDMRHAKNEAAMAKAKKDKDGQKQAGAIIGRLRREMQELGIGDEDLEKVVVCEERDTEEQGASSDDASHDDGGTNVAFDLFGDDAPDEPEPKMNRNMAYASIVLNKSLRETVKGKKKNGAHTKAHPKKHPKAILQQLVQKEGWGAPRFEKISKDVHEDKYRFQILIDVKQSKGKHSLRPGIHRVALPAELDGWDTIQEAQDACATKALMDLYGKTNDVEWETLSEPFDALVFDIAEHQGQDTCCSETASQAREEFLDSLLTSVYFDDTSCQEETLNESRKSSAMHKMMESISGKLKEFASTQVAERSRIMHRDLSLWKESEDGLFWMVKRNALPVSQIRESLLKGLEMHDVVLVSGETGSGKTTQVPQIVLDGCIESLQGGKCSIVCTQPRRIAAISVADRVSEERGEDGPGNKGSVVGYSVRFDSATNSGTRLEFCTTGILLRRLSTDPALAKFSHIIVDEVHERTMQSDFLIAMLRELVDTRRQAGLPLKVILMSATMNTRMVSDYFYGCPILNASGRTYPVEHLFLEDVYEISDYVLDMDSPAAVKGQGLRGGQKKLENSSGSKHKSLIKSNWGDDIGDVVLNQYFDETMYDGYSPQTIRNLSRVNEDKIDMDLLEHVVMYIHETQDPGAMLVFVPGMGEIDNLSKRLLSQRALKGHVVVPLHSSISPKDQKNAFKIHPKGVRKIVISTNIAETSVTIEDIVYVVDTGKHKERRHDASRSMSMLVEDTISVANANQRKGRAGRVREGVCYSLYTRACYEDRMKKFQTPEIMRVPLEEMILQIHHLNLSNTADEFLSKVLQPPQKKSVAGAITNLIQAGALTREEDLTALGGHLAQLPVDVNVGKMLIMGTFFECLSPILSIAACLSHKSPFLASHDKEDIRAMVAPFLSKDKTCLSSEQQSDHLVLAAVLQGWIDARQAGGISSARKYAKKYNLSIQNVEIIMEMRDQFATMLEHAGVAQRGKTSGLAWYDSGTCPQNTYKDSPDVVRAVLVASLYPKIAVVDEFVPGSIPTWHDGAGSVVIHPTSLLSTLTGGSLQRSFIVYSEKMKTTKVFVKDCTIASPLSILLFGGNVQIDHRSGKAVIDGWIRIKVSGRCAAILLLIREKFESALDTTVEKKLVLDKNSSKGTLLKILSELLEQEQSSLSWNSK